MLTSIRTFERALEILRLRDSSDQPVNFTINPCPAVCNPESGLSWFARAIRSTSEQSREQ